jgi:hypothetical protein
MDCPQAHTSRREVESVREFFKGHTGHVDTANSYGQHGLNAVLLAPV